MKTLATAVLLVACLIVAGRAGQAGTSKERTQSPEVGLHLAALQGNVEAVRQHIEAGSDLDEKDAYGSTPLIIATTFGRTGVAEILIEAGADPDLRNNEGSTALHIAAFLGRTGIVEALLNRGADKYLRNDAGHTAQESVTGSFEAVRGVYDDLARALGPLGLELDYARLRAVRPAIAQLLRPRPEELEAVAYTPLSGDGWPVSTPEAQGLDPMRVAELYLEADALPTLYGLLLVRNGRLIAEGYFNEGSVEQVSNRQSVTKSHTSALVGLALEQGCLSGVEQKMMEFFPEFADRIDDPRKARITIRDLLQMRAGYPWEERTPPYMEVLFLDSDWHWLPRIVDIPLTSDPGTAFGYSNLSSHILGVIVARACGADLASYAREHLFAPIGAEPGDWYRDADGYHFGSMGLSVTARDMARFGLLYLAQGRYDGKPILPAAWVRESLQSYSEHIDLSGTGTGASAAGRYFRDLGYGYQWWSAKVGERRFDFAWGHGGNLIILLDELDMLIVTTADPLEQVHWNESWKHEGAIINLVGKFIRSLSP